MLKSLWQSVANIVLPHWILDYSDEDENVSMSCWAEWKFTILVAWVSSGWCWSQQRGISATNDSQDTKLFVQFVTPSDAIKRFPSRQILVVIDVCSLYSWILQNYCRYSCETLKRIPDAKVPPYREVRKKHPIWLNAKHLQLQHENCKTLRVGWKQSKRKRSHLLRTKSRLKKD